MKKSNVNTVFGSCKIADNISITVNLEDESSCSEYRSFCNKLKINNSIDNLSEEDKLKLFLLAGLMAPSNLHNLLKDRTDLILSNEYGTLTLRALNSFDSLFVKGSGDESLKRDNRFASVVSLYDLSLKLSDAQKFDQDFIYNFLMNFGSRMAWTQNPKVAEILSSCVSDVTEKLCKNKFEDITTIRYVGRIDWLGLKDAIKNEFGASIKTRKSDYSDIWNVYIDLLESIFQCDIKQIASARKAISKGEWIENSLQFLVDEINQKYGIDIKVWQIKGMIRKPLSNKHLADTLLELVRSKRLIYPILKE
mgnify:CR=1 FL=1